MSVFTLSMVNINKQLTPLLLLNICLNWVYTQKEGSHFRDIFLPTSYPSPSHIHLFSIYSHYSIFMKEQIQNFDIPGSRQTKVIFTNNQNLLCFWFKLLLIKEDWKHEKCFEIPTLNFYFCRPCCRCSLSRYLLRMVNEFFFNICWEVIFNQNRIFNTFSKIIQNWIKQNM